MTTDPLAATASIWSRLPHEANLDRRSPSTSHSREHPPAAAAPPSSRSTGAAPSGLAGASPFSASLEFGNPSPRSSISSSSFASATTPTPESSNSPRTSTTKPLVSPPPSQSQAQHQQRSPRLNTSLAFYGQQGPGFNGVRAGPAHEPSATTDSLPSRRASLSFASSYAQSATASSGPFSPPLYSPSITSPPPSSQAPPASSASNSNQPLLAEIFSGNPRPHYRTSTSLSHSSSQASPRSDGNAQALLSPSLHYQQQQQEGRSYFAAPPQPLHGRGRSQSSAPAFDPSRSSQGPTSPLGMSSPFGAPGNGSPQQQQQQQQQQPADQHGWRPSSSIGPGSALHFSASLPTASAVGSPSLSAFANGASARDPSSSPSSRAQGSGNGNGYSPFSPPSLASPSSTSRGSGALSHSFSTGWEDFEREREGRARFRDQWSAAGGNVGGGGGGGGGSSRDISVGPSSSSTGTGTGIGLSNMSPFSRDGARATLAGGPDFPSSFGGDGTWGAPSQGGASAYKARREYSLGAVGTGRKRSDSAWGTRERPLKEQDEDDEGGGGDGFAPPTKSGATSRRHSFAAFEQPSVLGRSQTIGFHLPEEPQREPFGNGFGMGGGMGNGLKMGGLGSSAINDDDLAADLNSLHLSLDAHAKEQQQQQQQQASLTPVFPHVGSMPADFPPARSSRGFESSRSPPLSSARSSALPPPSPATTTSLSLHGSSPRATAEPFTPSFGAPSTSSSAASRFLMSPPAPAPLPPTTTTATATASTGAAASRFDFGGQAQQQQRYGLPPPMPPPATQHSYFSAVAPPPPPPSQSRGPGGPPPLGSTFSPFAPGSGQPYHTPSLPPPHMSMSHSNAYFAPPPPSTHLPVTIPALPPSATSLTAQSQSDMNLGRGVPLHAIPPDAPLCIVGFKAGRKDLFFCEDPSLHLEEGDLVIVEADRGRDVGKYLKRCTVEEVQKFQQHLVELALGQLANPTAGGMGGGGFGGPGGGPGGSGGGGGGAGTAQLARMTKECQPKRIYAKAGPADTHALLAKAQDEVKALALVRSKVAQKGLPMEILDAEWQWDRRKLTFYYTSDQRVDFRELVRELFRIWKTRVWLCCLDQQQPSLDIA
ncbi:hypothetical protein JCM5296_006949 [Sporobolomyces johnsonii]